LVEDIFVPETSDFYDNYCILRQNTTYYKFVQYKYTYSLQ